MSVTISTALLNQKAEKEALKKSEIRTESDVQVGHIEQQSINPLLDCYLACRSGSYKEHQRITCMYFRGGSHLTCSQEKLADGKEWY